MPIAGGWPVHPGPLVLPDGWTPDQAFAVAEFLIACPDAIWEGSGRAFPDTRSGPPAGLSRDPPSRIALFPSSTERDHDTINKRDHAFLYSPGSSLNHRYSADSERFLSLPCITILPYRILPTGSPFTRVRTLARGEPTRRLSPSHGSTRCVLGPFPMTGTAFTHPGPAHRA